MASPAGGVAVNGQEGTLSHLLFRKEKGSCQVIILTTANNFVLLNSEPCTCFSAHLETTYTRLSRKQRLEAEKWFEDQFHLGRRWPFCCCLGQ